MSSKYQIEPSGKLKIDFLKISSPKLEEDIESTFLNLKKKVIEKVDDNSMVIFEMKRQHLPAFVGNWYGIEINTLLMIPPCVFATIEIWKLLAKKLKTFRKKSSPRLNLFALENICRLDLIDKQKISEFKIESYKWLVKGYYFRDDFEIMKHGDPIYDKKSIAKFTFSDKKYKYIYIVDNDGEISSFSRKRKIRSYLKN